MAYCVKNGINRKGGCIAITELIQIILYFLFFVFTRMGLEAISRSQMYLTITQLKIASVQNSRKLGCPAEIQIRSVNIYGGFTNMKAFLPLSLH